MILLIFRNTSKTCDRIGLKSEKEITYDLQIQIGKNNNKEQYKITLNLTGNKEEEYIFKIVVSGFFRIEGKCNGDEVLIQKNAVSIIMPYLRTEVSLLTAQPETDTVVLPVFNINAMMDGKKE